MIGIYVYLGVSLDSFDNKMVMLVISLLLFGSFEVLLKIVDYLVVFVDFFYIKNKKGILWMYILWIVLYWGFMEE